MIRAIENTVFLVVTGVLTAAPAFAGPPPPSTPLPVLGLGLPALALVGLAYRRLRNRGED